MRTAVAMGLLAALAGGVRAHRWREVFTPDGVLFPGGDPYYHAWRVRYSVEHFPAVLSSDPFLNFPHGADVPWPPGFDWALAALVRLVLGTDDPAGAEVLLAWSPVLLAVGTVPVAMAIALRLSNLAGACTAGLGVALLPAAYEYTQIGYADHHAAVFLLGTALLAGTLRVVSHPGPGPRLWPLSAAALAAAGLLAWPGFLLHLLLAQGGLLAWLATAPGATLARQRALRLALAHASTALLLLPFCYGKGLAGYGTFTPLALSAFQPAWFGAGALCFLAVEGLWRVPVLGGTRHQRALSGAATAALGIALTFALVPELADALARSAGWFGGEERFQEQIGELAPLLGQEGAGWGLIGRLYSGLGYLLPLAWIAVLLRRPRALARQVLVAWSVVFTLATLSQYRFINSSSVAFSLVWGVALGDAVALARGRIGPLRGRGGAALALSALVVAALALPVWSYYQRGAGEDPLSFYADLMKRFRAAARFVAQATPRPVGADGEPEYGVLCSWGVGHLVRYYAERPVVQDNFGPYVSPGNVEAASRYYAARDESQAVSILDEMGVRYVLVGWQGAGGPGDYPPSSLTRRMVRFRGAEVALRTKEGIQILPGLTRHRLLYEVGSEAERVQVWERVAGATVVGRARPGDEVRAELVLEGPALQHAYEVSVRADEGGRYALRLPYATTPDGGWLRPVGPYRLRAGAQSAELEISEEAVLSGATLAGPDLGG